MSYDLMVFEKTKAPNTKKEFMVWYDKQTEWEEEHDYETIGVSSPNLQNWFMEMKDTFIPMNGEYAPNFDNLAEDEAYELMRDLAKKHNVGFFDVSGEKGDIILPDGTRIE